MIDGMLGHIAPPDYITDTQIDIGNGALEASTELLDSIPDPEGSYEPPILNSIEDAVKFIQLCQEMGYIGYSYSKQDSNRDALIFNSGNKSIIVRIN